ncbi:MAG: hypothetical protein QOF69_2183 [Solirubrobacteraceae bacterium]|nr:hypothetical protein [Solirubrobacteraceae bacterium]
MPLLRRGDEIITGRGPSAQMSSRRWIGAAVLSLLVLTPTALAGAQKRDVSIVEGSRLLWATVNVCDTENSPKTIGIRGSMPGLDDARETMWMRFRVEYLSEEDHRWHDVTEGGDSGFVPVGSARNKARQGGRSFRINPKNGKPVVLRGRVSFEWRLRGDVVRRASARTRKGYESSAAADPPGYTAATCTISP